MIQQRAFKFITRLKEREIVTAACFALGLQLLKHKHRDYRLAFLIKILQARKNSTLTITYEITRDNQKICLWPPRLYPWWDDICLLHLTRIRWWIFTKNFQKNQRKQIIKPTFVWKQKWITATTFHHSSVTLVATHITHR